MTEKKLLFPFYKEILDDLETPVSLYLKLNVPNSFLLESVTGGENLARFSFIGFDPFCQVTNDYNETTITLENKTSKSKENPISILRNLNHQFDVKKDPLLPDFFGGAIGFFSWEIIHHIEKINKRDKEKTDFPLMHFLFPGSLVIFDHVKRKVIILVLAEKEDEQKAKQKIAEIEKRILKPLQGENKLLTNIQKHIPFEKIQSNFKKEDFKKAVEKAKNYIFEGDIFQLVLSQKFSFESKENPFDIYRKLRFINPSPYMFYYNTPEFQIIGTSPEILVRSDNRIAELRPIAGTRQRPDDFLKEPEVIADLLQDEKERAEHIMLVDLARNDLNRVADEVKTENMFDIEKYSRVIHMVTKVTGKLKLEFDAFDLFKATFPAGTVSGAPKIRAMEIIEELEPCERGPYAGAMGYFDFQDNLNFCIIIRTILAKAGKLYVQAGAGIVTDSDPEKEYQETCHKAYALLQAIL